MEEEDEEDGELEELKLREVERDNFYEGGSENGGREVKEEQGNEMGQLEECQENGN